MNRFQHVYGLVVALWFCCAALADTPDTINIPLVEIWGYNLAGTRPIRELEPETASIQALGHSASEIRHFLATKPKGQIKARSGFVVPGSGSEALRQAHAVLVGNKEPNVVAASDPVSLIFFSHQAGFSVELCGVTRNKNHVEIQYQLTPQKAGVLRASFAVIPLGTLPSGNFSVKPIQQLEGGEKGKLLAKWGDQVVCSPFSFDVEK